MQVNQTAVDARQGMDAMRAMLAAGQSVSLTVTGHSMAPLLRHMRDGVTIGPLPSFPPNVNDIIFCQRENGSPVMHRVYRIDGGTVWINGDAQTWLEPVTEDRVIGVVTHIRRGAKQYLVNAPWIRFYTIAWGLLRPIRGFGFNLYRRAKGLGAR